MLQAAGVTFGFIRRFISGEPQALTDTPEDSYERRLTAVEREICTLGVLVSQLTADFSCFLAVYQLVPQPLPSADHL